jgi:IclR family acetate operon transcriptional repressor
VSSAVSKAFNIVRLLRRSPAPLTLTEIARGVKIAPSTAHSLLSELHDQGVLIQNGERRYHLGPSLFYYGASFARAAPIYRSTWRDLVLLGNELSLTAVVAVPWENHHLILDVHGTGAAGLDVAFGGRVPIDAGAWGKAYYAWSGEALPATLTPYTPTTVRSPEQYAAEVEQSRRRGYAVDLEEIVPGAGAVAGAVTGADGFEGIVALVGLVSDIAAIGETEVGRRLAAVATRASYALGDGSRMTVVGGE